MKRPLHTHFASNWKKKISSDNQTFIGKEKQASPLKLIQTEGWDQLQIHLQLMENRIHI